MLVSHFNIHKSDSDEEVQEEVTPSKEDEVKKTPSQTAEKEHREVRIDLPVRRLNKSEISVRLSLLGKTATGDGFTYLKAACTSMGLSDISALVNFKHLQFIDVSDNNLDFYAFKVIAKLPFVVLIKADANIIKSAALRKMKYLQVLIMNSNQIDSTYHIYQPELRTLEIGNNKINKVSFKTDMLTMKCLDLRNNFITDISDINVLNLDSLYLAGNKIHSLKGISKLVSLRVLHLRGNPIKLLDGFEEPMIKLEYINLRGCGVKTLIQVKKLRVLTGLQTLILTGTPYMNGGNEGDAGPTEDEEAELRITILASLQRLKRLNKEEFTEEERKEAKDLIMKWLEEGENDEEEEEEEDAIEEMTPETGAGAAEEEQIELAQ